MLTVTTSIFFELVLSTNLRTDLHDVHKMVAVLHCGCCSISVLLKRLYTVLSRCAPCQLTSLDHCQIVKVIAGGMHSLALSAACQVGSA